MKQYFVLFTFLIGLSILVGSCRPPEVEGAFVHYNAGRIDQAYDLALKATEMYPANEEAWYLLGEIQGKKSMIKDMVQSFDKSLQIKNTFETKINAAKLTYFGKFYNEGVSKYNTFLKIEDKDSENAHKTADLIVENFSNALILQKDYMANRLIAIVYQNMEDDDNTLKYFQAAANTKPDTALAWIELGYYWFQKKDYSKSAENFKKAIDVEPTNTEALTMYAQNLDFSDKKEEAIVAYKNAIKINPEEKAIPFNLGLLLFKQSTAEGLDKENKNVLMDEAANYFKKAHELDPELKEIYDLLPSLLLQSEKYNEAKQILDKGLEIYPDSPSLWQNLSYLYAKQGKKKEAEDAYKRAEQLQQE